MIGVASAAFPNTLLNREGHNRYKDLNVARAHGSHPMEASQ
jgi:hypothetical protein